MFQAAWALSLGRLTGSDNVTFGLMLSGREAPIADAHAAVGPLINLLPCHVVLEEPASLMRRMQAELADAMVHQNCSLADVAKALGARRPLFNTFLNMQRVEGRAPLDASAVRFNELDSFMTDEVGC